jgi:ABC-2 type transport system ATP-binding protein
MTWAVELDGLHKTFAEKTAVDRLSVNISEGSIFGFLGPNGAGKTTTIKMMLGLLKPDGGRGSIFGMNIIDDSVKIRQRIGYVAETQNMYGYMTVTEIISFCRSFYPQWNHKTVEKYLDMFHLPHKEKIKNFSKGMKTQLALVLALAPDPELLILDEPTSGLDALSRQEFLRIIIEELSVQGRTVFFSSHQFHDVERVADQVGIINQGRLIEVRQMDELKNTVKKIRVVFQREPDGDFFSQPGIVKVEKQGSAYLIAVENNLAEIISEIKQHPHFTLDIIDQNLEEIFIEKVRVDGE